MKQLKLILIFVLFNISAFAEPSWQEIQSTVKEQFHSRMDRVGAITKIVKRDEGSTELNREIYPHRYEFSQGGVGLLRR